MKKKFTKIRLSTFKYLLFLPILLLVYCQSNSEDPNLNSENRLRPDAKVLSLMKSAIKSDLSQNLSKNKGSLSKSANTEEDDQCTHFLYPMTFEVYSGDDPDPVLREINSDEELISFIDTLIASTTTYEFYIYFPITLLDTDGVETVINDLTELEGTLQMAVEACESFDDDSSGDNDEDDSDNDNGDDNSDDGSDDGNNHDDDNSSDDGTGEDEDDNDDNSNDDSGDNGSNDGSDEDSNDENDDGDDSSDDDSNNGYEYCDKNKKKVAICHKGKTICISVNAIWGHMTHHEEDYLGSCDE